MKVDSSDALHLDPKKSSLEDHIFALSPLKVATRDSLEYRARLNAGYRHPKTKKHPGGDYLYVPLTGNSQEYDSAHSYRLDRSQGRFTLTVHWQRDFQSEYFHKEDGWWSQGLTPLGPEPLPSPQKM